VLAKAESSTTKNSVNLPIVLFHTNINEQTKPSQLQMVLFRNIHPDIKEKSNMSM